MKSFQLQYTGLMTKIGERCGKQAVVTGALSDAMCHRIYVFVSLSMPIRKTGYTRLIIQRCTKLMKFLKKHSKERRYN